MSKTLIIHQSPEAPWFVELEFDYDKELKDWVKLIPGYKWVPERKRWRMASEMVWQVSKRFESAGYKVERKWQLVMTLREVPEYLYEWQADAVSLALSYPLPRWLFADDTGIGKSVQAIACCQSLASQKILVVCPAGVRVDWKEKFEKYWPERAEDVGVIWASKDRSGIGEHKLSLLKRAYSAPIQIVNPELIDLLEHEQWDAIVVDEAHMFKNPRSKPSGSLRPILRANPDAAVFALTATPMADRPLDAWNILDLLWPERFGRMQKNGNGSYEFKSRYLRSSRNSEGFEVFEGVKHEEELQMRLAAVSSRHSKTDPEVAKHLPPFDISLLRIPPPTDRSDFGFSVRSREDLERSLYAFGSEKLGPAAEWARGALETSDHVCLMTHRRGLAKELHGKLLGLSEELGVSVTYIDGSMAANERAESIRRSKAANKSILVCTMQSCGIGIDLTFCKRALIAELSYRFDVVVQAAGRFSRITGSPVPSSLEIMLLEGTADEIVADRLLDKITDISSVMKSGMGEKLLSNALEDSDEHQGAFEDSILRMCAEIEDDIYE